MAAAVYWPELNLCVFVYNRDTRVKIVLGKSCLEDNFPIVNVPDFTLRQSVMETDKAEIPGNFDIIFGNASISCIKFSSGIMRKSVLSFVHEQIRFHIIICYPIKCICQ